MTDQLVLFEAPAPPAPLRPRLDSPKRAAATRKRNADHGHRSHL